MPFVQAKCDSCGAILSVDSTLKTATCSHCGSTYVVQESINNYNSDNNISHLHADVVNILDESSAEGRLKAADAFVKLKKFDEAERDYLKVTQLTPQDYRAWLGLLVVRTKAYTKRLRKKADIHQLDELVNSVKILAGPGSEQNVLAEYYNYLASERAKNDKEKEEIDKLLVSLSSKTNELNTELNRVSQEDSSVAINVEEAKKLLDNHATDGNDGLSKFMLIISVIMTVYGVKCIASEVYMTVVMLILAALSCSVFVWYRHEKNKLTKNYNDILSEHNKIHDQITGINTELNKIDREITEAKTVRSFFE